jgi:hypothetical protein
VNTFPEESKLSVAGRLATLASVSLVPFVGGPIGVFVSEAYAQHSSKKLQDFFEQVITRVADLEKVATPEGIESLLSEPEFRSILFEAAKISERTLHDHKIELLKNAVVNSRKSDQGKDKQRMFLRYVDELTESHLLLLTLLDNPRGFYAENNLVWSDWMMGGKSTLIAEAFPDWETNFVDQLVRDLNSRGLLAITTIHAITTPQGMADSSSTGLGKEFTYFISAGEQQHLAKGD